MKTLLSLILLLFCVPVFGAQPVVGETQVMKSSAGIGTNTALAGYTGIRHALLTNYTAGVGPGTLGGTVGTRIVTITGGTHNFVPGFQVVFSPGTLNEQYKVHKSNSPTEFVVSTPLIRTYAGATWNIYTNLVTIDDIVGSHYGSIDADAGFTVVSQTGGTAINSGGFNLFDTDGLHAWQQVLDGSGRYLNVDGVNGQAAFQIWPAETANTYNGLTITGTGIPWFFRGFTNEQFAVQKGPLYASNQIYALQLSSNASPVNTLGQLADGQIVKIANGAASGAFIPLNSGTGTNTTFTYVTGTTNVPFAVTGSNGLTMVWVRTNTANGSSVFAIGTNIQTATLFSNWNGTLSIIASNGAPAVTVNGGNGNVGVGTASPNTPVDIRGQAAVPQNSLFVTTSNFTFLSSGTVLRFGHGAATGDTYSQIDSLRAGGSQVTPLILQNSVGAFVGIGTTTPANRLDVEGGVAIGAAYSGTSTAPTDGLIVVGNIGIGTTTPAEKLSVIGNQALSGTNIATNGFSSFMTNYTPQVALTLGGGATNTTGRIEVWNIDSAGATMAWKYWIRGGVNGQTVCETLLHTNWLDGVPPISAEIIVGPNCGIQVHSLSGGPPLMSRRPLGL